MIQIVEPLTITAILATGIVIDQSTMLPIGEVAGCFAAVWWVGRKLQAIDDRLRTGDEKFKTLGEELTALHREATAATLAASNAATAAAAAATVTATAAASLGVQNMKGK